jgi:UDP-glucose 4-epimerase
MNVLITGGAGYIGNELVYELSRKEEVKKIVIFDNLSRKNYNFFLDNRLKSPKLHFVNGDVIDTAKLTSCLRDTDVVYHLAGMGSSGSTFPRSHFHKQINHWGTAELAQALEGTPVKRLIYLSSTAVYGFGEHPVYTGTPPCPSSEYAKSKLLAEKKAERLMNDRQVYIVRISNVYGYSPGIRYEPLINRLMFECSYLRSIQAWGNPDQIRSYIHIHEAVHVLASLTEGTLPTGIYNLTRRLLSLNEIISEFKTLFPDVIVSLRESGSPSLHRMVMPDDRLNYLNTLPVRTFIEELIDFRGKFMHAIPVYKKEAV